MLTAQDIMAIIPHRYPFLLIDRVVELEPGVRAVAEKLVSANEPQFQGHFPGNPVMPGVLIVEAMAQAGAVAALSLPEHAGKLVLFAGIDDCRFKRVVRPGETLRLEVRLDRMRRGVGRGSGRATVGDELACASGLLFALTNP
ncbi:3-hydroxyacyl-ACP dehydratase FabZ [Candidatus Viridilinea mediisalina]|uniref:3-hydroxyacyl-[acyl-carrier-protein] dehydratase FabZ n=1 Tax=Candidatus Viridilinea mediisalina TaxID=2024553 RepID=A0A2A6RI98_9CHLR|nr:3-hydroxyacyl-ACP dehydratase FabZ [Candidatus Viridilinea mediisalina]PDW02854.1 3-hydroxyacyl-[acyl-carrier-protein] dehydratase FabZ [Candidatus Viridilinea mediisalina]